MEAAQQVEEQSTTGQIASDPEDAKLGQTIGSKALPVIPFRTTAPRRRYRGRLQLVMT